MAPLQGRPVGSLLGVFPGADDHTHPLPVLGKYTTPGCTPAHTRYFRIHFPVSLLFTITTCFLRSPGSEVSKPPTLLTFWVGHYPTISGCPVLYRMLAASLVFTQ